MKLNDLAFLNGYYKKTMFKRGNKHLSNKLLFDHVVWFDL